MINAKEAAKWFIYRNPELSSGYIDENTKINKLLYFSNLMHYCVDHKVLFDEEFVAFPNGPVVFSVYRDYRYHGLNLLPQQSPRIEGIQGQILDIINFVYGDMSADQLVKESHTHSLWRNVRHLIRNHQLSVDIFKESGFPVSPKLRQVLHNIICHDKGIL